MSKHIDLTNELRSLQAIPYQRRTIDQAGRIDELFELIARAPRDYYRVNEHGNTVFRYRGIDVQVDPRFVPPPLLPSIPSRGNAAEWKEWLAVLEAFREQAIADHVARGGDVHTLDLWSLMDLQRVLSPEHGGWYHEPVEETEGHPDRPLLPGFEWYKTPFGWVQRRPYVPVESETKGPWER